MEILLKTFKALADRNRLRILKILEKRPMCVCEITYILGLATSTVSSHLSILHEAALVKSDKQGKWVSYSLTSGHFYPCITQLLQEILVQMEADPQVHNDVQQAEIVNRFAICRINSHPAV